MTNTPFPRSCPDSADLQVIDDAIDHYAAGFTPDGLESDLLLLLSQVASRVVRLNVGESSSEQARGDAIDELLYGLRASLVGEFFA